MTDSDSILSYSPTERPGISNLLLILSSLSTSEPIRTPSEMAEELNQISPGGSKVLKEALKEKVIEELKPIREKFHQLKEDRSFLEGIEKKGREKARLKAAENLEQIKRLVGLLR